MRVRPVVLGSIKPIDKDQLVIRWVSCRAFVHSSQPSSQLLYNYLYLAKTAAHFTLVSSSRVCMYFGPLLKLYPLSADRRQTKSPRKGVKTNPKPAATDSHPFCCTHPVNRPCFEVFLSTLWPPWLMHGQAFSKPCRDNLRLTGWRLVLDSTAVSNYVQSKRTPHTYYRSVGTYIYLRCCYI